MLNPSTASAQTVETPLVGLRAVTEPLPWFDSRSKYPVYSSKTQRAEPNVGQAVTSTGRPPMDAPVSIKLSRYAYPAEDPHVDAIVRFDLPLEKMPRGRLQVTLKSQAGGVLSETVIDPIPGPQVFFSYRFPDEVIGGSGRMEIRWLEADQTVGEAAAEFQVKARNATVTAGRIRLTIDNDTGATIAAAPITMGVPFPRGALESTDHLRLVGNDGQAIPLQVKETARWSRFGSVKWVLCDFTVALDGRPRELFLEYGPDVTRVERDTMDVVVTNEGFPLVDAGRVRLDGSGLSFDVAGDGNLQTILSAEALTGAFVRHANNTDFDGWGHSLMRPGTAYKMPARLAYEVEETGPEKVVLRASDWYENAETGERFCQFVTRWVVHRDSPVVRIFHTWIFTGDGNRDRISNMGWRFGVNGMEPSGFLAGDGADAEWLDGDYLRQEDADKFTLFDLTSSERTNSSPLTHHRRPIKEKQVGRRATGVMSARGDGVQLYIGVRDFWQNYPRSLKQEEGALTFFEWPQYGRDRENPVSVKDPDDIWRLWFAHEGETLSFTVPQELTEGILFRTHSGPETRMLYGRPDSVNAQGIAKTAELWIYLAPEADAPGAGPVLQGIQNDALRAVVDPVWMTGSGVFHEIAPEQRELRPDDEIVYAENVRSALRDVERMGIYGKWIYGDLLTYPHLEARTVGLNRARATSWGYPFSFIPFARSGDPDFYRFARAATTYLTDVPFCHYASDELIEYFENLPKLQIWDKKPIFRRVGWWHSTNVIPWSGFWGPSARLVNDGAEWLWPAWYIAGHYRARDVALTWGMQTKIEEPLTVDRGLIGRGPITTAWNRGRWALNLQRQYQEMWEVTWDPWFLAGAQAIAEMQMWEHREKGQRPHIWNTGPSDFLRYSSSPEYRAFFLEYTQDIADWQYVGWAECPSVIIPPVAFLYQLTGEEYYRRRLAGIADLQTWAVFMADEPAFAKGHYVTGTPYQNTMQTSWMHKWFPLLAGVAEQGSESDERPIPLAFVYMLGKDARVAVRKEAGRELQLRVKGSHVITGPDNKTVKEGEADEVTLEAELPAGVYVLDLGARGVLLPLSPPDTPEVVLPAANETIRGGEFAQYWFVVPEGVESFQIEFDNPGYVNNEWLSQYMVWDADGRPVWVYRQLAGEYDPKQASIVADVQVEPGQTGRLWRLTLPGRRGVAFRLDPQIPRLLSHDPSRWFDASDDVEKR